MAFPKKMQPMILVVLLGIVFCSHLMAQGDCSLCDRPLLQATDGKWYCPSCSPEKFGAVSMEVSGGLSGTGHTHLLMNNILGGSVPVGSMPVTVGQVMQSQPLPAKQADQMQDCVLSALKDAGISSVAPTGVYQYIATGCSDKQELLADTLFDPEGSFIDALGLLFMFRVSTSAEELTENQLEQLLAELQQENRVEVIITDENGYPAMVGALLPTLPDNDQCGAYLIFGQNIFITCDQMTAAIRAVLRGLARANGPQAGTIYFYRHVGGYID